MCSVPYCHNKEIWITYYGFEICPKCWNRHCNNEIDLKEKLKVRRRTL